MQVMEEVRVLSADQCLLEVPPPGWRDTCKTGLSSDGRGLLLCSCWRWRSGQGREREGSQGQQPTASTKVRGWTFCWVFGQTRAPNQVWTPAHWLMSHAPLSASAMARVTLTVAQVISFP